MATGAVGVDTPQGSDQAGAPALEVAGLSSGYGEATVVRDIALRVPPGAVIAVLGANGAGKSTLLKTIAGIVKPSAGTVHMEGEDVTGLAPNERARRGLCYIPEGRAIFRSLTVRDNIRVQAVLGEEGRAVEQVAEAFPALRDRMGQLAGTMSGGEQQMLAVARAYITNPRMVMVDEASLGLAPKIVESIFGFLENLASTGASLLLVDQFATRVLSMASYGYIVRRGEIVFEAPAAELKESNLFARYTGGDPTE